MGQIGLLAVLITTLSIVGATPAQQWDRQAALRDYLERRANIEKRNDGGHTVTVPGVSMTVSGLPKPTATYGPDEEECVWHYDHAKGYGGRKCGRKKGFSHGW